METLETNIYNYNVSVVQHRGFATKKFLPTPCKMYGKFLKNSTDLRKIPSKKFQNVRKIQKFTEKFLKIQKYT